MSDSSPSFFEAITKIVVPLVQMGVVVIGWKFVSKDNDRREARKEIRSILGEAKKVLLEVEKLALEYYQLPATQGRDAETRLKRLLKDVGGLTTSATRLNHKVDVSVPLAEFRRAVTGKDFESAQRLPVSEGDPRLEEIAAATTRFLDETERIFAEAYAK